MQRLLQQMDRIYSQMPWTAFPSLPIHPSTHGDNSGGKETHRKWGAVDRTLFQERIPNPLLFFPFGKQRLTVVPWYRSSIGWTYLPPATDAQPSRVLISRQEEGSEEWDSRVSQVNLKSK